MTCTHKKLHEIFSKQQQQQQQQIWWIWICCVVSLAIFFWLSVSFQSINQRINSADSQLIALRLVLRRGQHVWIYWRAAQCSRKPHQYMRFEYENWSPWFVAGFMCEIEMREEKNRERKKKSKREKERKRRRKGANCALHSLAVVIRKHVYLLESHQICVCG